MRWTLLALLAGCVSPSQYAQAPYEPVRCATTIGETVPADGSADHYIRAPIEFHLSEADPTATVLADFAGVQTTRDDGRVIVYTPSEPLAPNTTYTVSLDYCFDTPSIQFTTSGYGQEMDVDIADLEGVTWVIDVKTARFPAGPNVGDLISSVFSDQLLISLAEVNGDQIVLRVALPEDDTSPIEQNVCMRTLDMPAAVLSEIPFFEVGAQNLVMDAYAGEIHLLDVSLAGTMAPDGSSVGGGALSLTLDAQDLVESLELFDVPTLCEFASNLGAPCGACPDDANDLSCIRVEVDSIKAFAEPGLSLEEITTPDEFAYCLD